MITIAFAVHNHSPLIDLSCVALCSTLEHLTQAFVAACPPPFTLITQQWSHVANKGEHRHFIRKLVPKGLWRSLSLPQPGITKPAQMLLLKQALINRRQGGNQAIYRTLEWLGNHPPLLGPDQDGLPAHPPQPVRVKYGPFSTSSSPSAPSPPRGFPSTLCTAMGRQPKPKKNRKPKAQPQPVPALFKALNRPGSKPAPRPKQASKRPRKPTPDSPSSTPAAQRSLPFLSPPPPSCTDSTTQRPPSKALQTGPAPRLFSEADPFPASAPPPPTQPATHA